MAEREDERRDTPPSGPDESTRDSEGVVGTEVPADELENLRRELEEANRKGQEYLGLLQRVQADFVNYRRRVEQERGESLLAGKGALALRILPVLDDFDRALKHVPPDLAGNEWVQGIELIARKLRTALEAEGITRMEPLGKEFDPYEEEALAQVPAPPEQAGKVVDVVQAGYKLGNKVLRPAQVVVGREA